MLQRIRFAIFDDAGVPLEEANPNMMVYRKADGTEAIPYPTIEEKGYGFYEFTVDPKLHGPVAYIIYCGPDAASTYQYGSVGSIVAFAMYDENGTPVDDRVPTFSVYTDGETELPTPSITNLGGGLYGFLPTPEPGKLIQYIVGDIDNTFWGTVGSVQLLASTPPENSEITNTQVLTFRVKDTEAFLGRVLIAIYYPEWEATELAWDGQAVCGPFTISSTSTTDDIQYSVLRNGGWPSSPTLRVFLTNFGGREL